MQHSKTLSLLCTLAFLVLDAECHPRLCGDDLTDALDRICTKGFNSKLKRTFMPLGISDNVADQRSLVTLDDYAEPGSLLARILLGEGIEHLVKTRRRRNGINEECCRKGCSYDELFAYCKMVP